MQNLSKWHYENLILVNERGLHARAAVKLVETMRKFDAKLELKTKDSEYVDAASVMDILLLAAAQGTQIEARAMGKQAETCLEALKQLFITRFDEEK